MSYNEQVIIRVDEITSSVKRKLQDLKGLSDECNIYRVPHRIRKIDEKSYTPQVVSIGPFHHGREELKPMEDHKRRYLYYLLQFTNNVVSLEQYIECIRDRETRLRNCYAEFIQLDSKEFIEMVLTDAAFIILLLVNDVFKLAIAGDRIHGKPKMIEEIRHDIMLLENQLPFFILEELLKLSKISVFFQTANLDAFSPVLRDGVNMIKLIHLFVEAWIILPGKMPLNYTFKADHFLQFLRIHYIPLGYHRKREEIDLSIPGALELFRVGVKIKPAWGKNLLEIEFRDGILEIPPLKINESTETLFQNLCALEQTHYVTSTAFFESDHTSSRNDQECNCIFGLITDYIAFMFQLVKDVEDVELLIREGIVLNRGLGSTEKVLSFFHNLDSGKSVSVRRFCYGGVIRELQKFHAVPWNRQKAVLKQEYFKNPWSGISVFAASVLLILTFIQAVSSVLQLKHK